MKTVKRISYIILALGGAFLLLLIYKGHVSRQMESRTTLSADGKTLAQCPDTPNCVSSFENRSDHQHHIPPQLIDINPSMKIENHFKHCHQEEASAHYWRYTCKSKILGFIDDIEILYLSAESKLHYRSASRVGKSDLGANRSRIQDLISSLK